MLYVVKVHFFVEAETKADARDAIIGAMLSFPTNLEGKEQIACSLVDNEDEIFTPKEKRTREAMLQEAPGMLKALKAMAMWGNEMCFPMGGVYDGPWEMVDKILDKFPERK